MRSVSIIGIGETRFGRLKDYSLRQMIEEAGKKAIADAGIEKEKLEALYIGNYNGSFFCGQSRMGPLASEVLELGNIPSMRTEGACASGSLAFRQGMIAIASGIYDMVIIGGVEKMTHDSTERVTEGIASAADSLLEVGIGATFPSLFALIANRYFHEYGDVREAMAVAAVQNHANAYLNPDAQLRKLITVDDVKNGLPVADPFTVYDCSLVSDGAVFIVLAASDIAEKLNPKRAVKILGSGHAGDTLTTYGKKSLTTLAATVKAADQAYKMSGKSAKEIDLVELHDCFTITQVISMEDLGFFEKGKGGQAVLDGKTARTGEIPVNLSGGLKAKGHPIGATGLSQIYELVTQLRGEGGERQIDKARIGLAHNLGGTAGTCVIHVLEGGKK